jgi:hypothetical protein
MATATAPKAATAGEDLRTLLGEQEQELREVLKLVPESELARAWAAGEVEFGHTKYCVSGNPESAKSAPTVILETGVEWSGPKTVRHGRFASILASGLPKADRYQKYQQEVLVSREKDAWDWVNAPEEIKGRETRWARRESDRKEAEALYKVYVRLTDKGLGVPAQQG